MKNGTIVLADETKVDLNKIANGCMADTDNLELGDLASDCRNPPGASRRNVDEQVSGSIDENDNVKSTSSTWNSRMVLLFLADQLLSGLVIGPLTVLYWRGTWTLLGRHVSPNRLDINGWICTVVGVSGLLLMLYGQRFLRRTLDVKNTLHWVVGFHLYTYIFGLLNVCHWRGIWTVLDHYTGINPASCWTTFAVGQCILWLLRSSRNSLAPPMVVVIDRDQNLFDYSTRFNAKVENKELYFLDAILTVGFIHTLVVFYWRGTWELFDLYLFPENITWSAVATLVIAYSLQFLMCAIQPIFNSTYRRTSSHVNRCILEVTAFFIANIIGVAHWRGFWLLCDEYIMPQRPDLSNILTHTIGMVVLMLLQCGHSVSLQGCDVEGDSSPDEGCLVPNAYFRHFFPRRREQRHPCPVEDCGVKPVPEESLSMIKLSQM